MIFPNLRLHQARESLRKALQTNETITDELAAELEKNDWWQDVDPQSIIKQLAYEWLWKAANNDWFAFVPSMNARELLNRTPLPAPMSSTRCGSTSPCCKDTSHT